MLNGQSLTPYIMQDRNDLATLKRQAKLLIDKSETCSALQKPHLEVCKPAAEYTVFAGGRSTAGSAPLGSIEVIRTTQQLDQVHAHITVQVVVLSDDLLNVALQSTKAWSVA